MLIIRNRIKCLVCGDKIESKSVHDFKECSCGAVAVDGGHAYLKRTGTTYEDLSVSNCDPHWKVRENLLWGTLGKDGKGPEKQVLLKDMSTDHIKNCIDGCFVDGNPVYKDAFKEELEYRGRVSNR